MSSRSVSVSPDANHDQLPGWLNSYVMMMEWLKEAGIWEEVPRRLRINRQGYQGVDVAMVLLAHWACPRNWGLKRFLEETKAYGDQLAAVAGRKSWPTQSAMSRALDDIDPADVEEFGEWLLEQTALQATDLLTHSGACWQDSDGQPRQVFHADGTVEAQRQRSLPDGDHLPPPRRFAAGLGEPGFAGRKRGEVQYKATLIQETGTGLWVGAELAAGNGCFSEAVSKLTESAERWVQMLGDDDRRATVITDGEAKGISQAQVGAKSELEFGTRLSCYELLDEPQVREHLEEATWNRVEDSGSGPTRWATEGGTIRLKDVRLRVVVSRYRTDNESGGAPGKALDGWRYELFGFDAESIGDVSPAEAVTLYYGRNAEENRFADRNREFCSPEVVSFEPGGQYLGIVMSLVAWNLETILGSQAEQPLEEVQERPETRDQAARQLPGLPRDPESEDLEEASGTCSAEIPFDELVELIKDYDWEERLEDDWAYDPQTNEVICPRGESLTFGDARRVDDNRIQIRYRNSYSACSNCPLRDQCSRSTRERFRREFTIRINVDPDAYETPVGRFGWEPPPTNVPTHQPQDETRQRPPQLVPSAFRRRYRMLCRQLTVEVTVESLETTEDLSEYLAPDAAARQRRRQSWDERLKWNEHQGDCRVEFEVPSEATAQRIQRMLAPGPPPEEPSAQSG